MKVLRGNFFKLIEQNKFDVVLNEMNCFCNPKTKVAKKIFKKFPEARKVDLDTGKGNYEKLGDYSAVKVSVNNQDIVIINMYTHVYSSLWRCSMDYEAIQRNLRKISENFAGMRIGYKQFAAHMDGNWNVIKKIIKQEFANMDHYFVP